KGLMRLKTFMEKTEIVILKRMFFLLCLLVVGKSTFAAGVEKNPLDGFRAEVKGSAIYFNWTGADYATGYNVFYRPVTTSNFIKLNAEPIRGVAYKVDWHEAGIYMFVLRWLNNANPPTESRESSDAVFISAVKESSEKMKVMVEANYVDRSKLNLGSSSPLNGSNGLQKKDADRGAIDIAEKE